MSSGQQAAGRGPEKAPGVSPILALLRPPRSQSLCRLSFLPKAVSHFRPPESIGNWLIRARMSVPSLQGRVTAGWLFVSVHLAASPFSLLLSISAKSNKSHFWPVDGFAKTVQRCPPVESPYLLWCPIIWGVGYPVVLISAQNNSLPIISLFQRPPIDCAPQIEDAHFGNPT